MILRCVCEDMWVGSVSMQQCNATSCNRKEGKLVHIKSQVYYSFVSVKKAPQFSFKLSNDSLLWSLWVSLSGLSTELNKAKWWCAKHKSKSSLLLRWHAVALLTLSLLASFRKLYWTDGDSINMANTDGSNRSVLFSNQKGPVGEWCARTSLWPHEEQHTLVTGQLSTHPNLCFSGLSIDFDTEQLYWISSGNSTINRCKLDGSGLEVLEGVKGKLTKATALAIMGRFPEKKGHFRKVEGSSRVLVWF